MEKMQEKKVKPQQPMQNIHIMREEPHEEYHSVNIVTRSGMTTREDKGKQPEAEGWVNKIVKKEVEFDLNKAKDTFMEANNSFVEASTSRSQEKLSETSTTQEEDPSLLATFLKTCMKLLRDKKVAEGL